MAMPRNWKPAIVTVIALVVILAGAAFAYARYGGKIAARLRGSPPGAVAPLASDPSGDASRSTNNTAAAVGSAVPGGTAAQNPKPSDAIGTAATDPLELTLQTSKLVDVTIVADGTTIFSGPIDAGDKRQFEAHDVLDVTSSDSSAIILELNGRPVAALGQTGLPGSVRLTRNDLRVPPGDSH
jgi:hypothetical protein